MSSLKDIYYDASKGYWSLEKLYKKAKEEIPNITRDKVKKFLEEQEVHQVYKQPEKPKEFNSIVANGKRDCFQLDIIIYDRYKVNGYQYILCVIDVHTRYAECRAMTTRENVNILYKLKDIFKELGIPKNINCDNEFNTKMLNEYFKKEGISMHYSEPNEINKNAIVERFNKTLSGLLQKWRIASGKRDWVKVLDDIVYNYNNTVHRTIKATPYDVWNGIDKNKQRINFVDNEFKKGDKIRVKIKKAIFSKGDTVKYSREVYYIVRVSGNKIYLLGSDRPYKPYEIVKIENIIYKDLEPPAEVVTSKKKSKLLKEIEDHLSAPTEKRVLRKRKK